MIFSLQEVGEGVVVRDNIAGKDLSSVSPQKWNELHLLTLLLDLTEPAVALTSTPQLTGGLFKGNWGTNEWIDDSALKKIDTSFLRKDVSLDLEGSIFTDPENPSSVINIFEQVRKNYFRDRSDGSTRAPSESYKKIVEVLNFEQVVQDLEALLKMAGFAPVDIEFAKLRAWRYLKRVREGIDIIRNRASLDGDKVKPISKTYNPVSEK